MCISHAESGFCLIVSISVCACVLERESPVGICTQFIDSSYTEPFLQGHKQVIVALIRLSISGSNTHTKPLSQRL